MSIALKYAVKTITATIGTDVVDQAFGTLTGTVVSAAVISAVQQTSTTVKVVVFAVYY